MSQEPMIVFDSSEGLWFCVTAYEVVPEGISVIEKFDVTERINDIMEIAIIGAISPGARRN